MNPNLLKLLTFWLLLFYFNGQAQEIWRESFSFPDKGIWGNENGSGIQSDFEGITKWSLDYSNVLLTNGDDYAKTVTTSDGRFECRDINGEVVWYSETIDISAYKNCTIQLTASETGSGTNEETKYLKTYFRIDKSEETPFETNGINVGNWGSSTAEQPNLNGNQVQVIVYLNNHYSADKVILDELVITGEEKNPVSIEPGEVLINEVLFNPVPDGEDFVEVYNNSEKVIPLNKLYLASRDNDLNLTQVYPLSREKYELESESYLALTKDTNGVFPWFTIQCPGCFLQMEKFPSYNNDEDYVVLLNSDMEIIDEFYYNEKMHMPLLYDREGISLERISFTGNTNDPSNWHSASTESGYGTPGYQNSQFENEERNTGSVTFAPKAFSPNNDGYNDIYSIHFALDKPGYLANIWIFDSAGRLVTQLCKNNILGTSDQIKWDGEDETGQRQKLGAYIVLVELFNTEGYVKRYKDGVVLTDILE
ncbi:gliding motility-associated C-terminal domain-containing protein [Prolixibacteraceae bacterium Z1-6]|uniref:Gliding motility-associated C-terminal domain-containing protein n=1 Tax=Draconibacterium aestuarii TaxID=2998507 RepID=A0A9X3FAD2_9BACT|nr:gliding motility-associated C-terminal domain-containing protein [Prolixibacteraceae bacterium Z1-6]